MWTSVKYLSMIHTPEKHFAFANVILEQIIDVVLVFQDVILAFGAVWSSLEQFGAKEVLYLPKPTSNILEATLGVGPQT